MIFRHSAICNAVNGCSIYLSSWLLQILTNDDLSRIIIFNFRRKRVFGKRNYPEVERSFDILEILENVIIYLLSGANEKWNVSYCDYNDSLYMF